MSEYMRKKSKQEWYKLDNAGKLYPSIASTRRSTVFRLSAKLSEDVSPEKLQLALDQTINRFPYYKVNLKRGLFWYYFEEARHVPKIQKETHYPCMFLKFRKKKTFPFRVLYYKTYIHFEISHSVADGTGAMSFFKTLLIQYMHIDKGIECRHLYGAKDIEEKPDSQESEDAFKRYYNPKVPVPEHQPKAMHFPFPLVEKGRYIFLTGIVPVKKLKELSKEYGCTITQLIAALYFESIQEYMKETKKGRKRKLSNRIVINIPVDLRQLFPSESMKNFFVSLTPEIDLRIGEYSLEEIIAYLKGYMQIYYTEKNISRYITRNVKNERILFVRALPLYIKNLIMPYIYVKFGEKGYTTSVSNLGLVVLPEEIQPYVDAIEFYPAPSEVNKIKMCLCSYKDHCYISFGKTVNSTEIEKYFFRNLRKLGVPIKIETNQD
jgi:NRPS condensation-like uncharacterized protein